VQKIILLILLVILAALVARHYFAPPNSANEVGHRGSTPIKLAAPKYNFDYKLAYSPNKPFAPTISPKQKRTLITLLEEHNFKVLDSKFEEVATQYENGDVSERYLNQYLNTYNLVNPAFAPALLSWVKTTNSWAAKITAARYFNTMSWQWRGNSFWSKTPALNQQQYEKYQSVAAKLIESAQHLSKRDSLWYSDKITYANQGSGEDERELINQGLSKFPDSKEIYHSAIHSQQERWGGDQAYRQKLIYALAKLEDGDEYDGGATVHLFRAADARKNKEDLNAVKHMRTALQLNPNRPYYYRNLANYLNAVDRYEEALAAINIALEHDPSDVKLLALRSDIYLNMKHPAKAVNDIKQLLEYSPYDKKANKSASKIYGLLGERDKAYQSLINAEYFAKQNHRELVNLGHSAEHQLKDQALGEKYYKRAEKINPLSAGAHYNLATLYGDQESCKIVEHLYKYLQSCREQHTAHWCASERHNWAYSAINFMQEHQKCTEINDFDFEDF